MENYRRRFLIVTEGPNLGQAYVLQDMVCTLGRTADNTIVIDSPRISRHHTQIRLLPDGAIVEDMGSTNGTWVNNRQLTGPHRLKPGDVIGLADYITFRFENDDVLRTEKLTPAPPDTVTQVMDDTPLYTPPPPSPSDYEEPYRAYTTTDAAPQYPPLQQPPMIRYDTTPPPAGVRPPTPAPPAKRKPWVYVVVAILLILICICIAVAVYLWFAPVTFWQRVFELFNIPIP